MKNHAIVLGGSVAGVLAAKVLSQTFNTVTVVERCKLSNDKSIAPQADQFHILLGSGLRALDQLYPGFSRLLVADGGVFTSATKDWHLLFSEGWLKRFESELEVICCSRDLLESAIRRCCFEQNIEWIDGCDVKTVELSQNAKPRVLVAQRHQSNKKWLTSDLIVDCTGANSRALDWLVHSGYQTPLVESISAHLGYACQRFSGVTMPEDCKAALITPKAPTNPIGAAIMPIENDQWMVAQYGFAKHYPSTDQTKFLDGFANLRDPLIAKALENATPVSALQGFRKERNVFKHFDRLNKWPKGFVVFGDALASLNPYYGQGMSTAAMAAITLKKAVESQKSAQQIQKKISAVYRAPWLASSTEDLRWPETECNAKVQGVNMAHKMSDRLIRAATKSDKACDAFLNAMHMTKPASSLLAPGVCWAMLKHGAKV